MKFSEIRQKLIDSDNQALAEWEARRSDWFRGPPSLEEHLAFVEHRRSTLAGGVSLILMELVERFEKQNRVSELEAAIKPFADAYKEWSGGDALHHFSTSVTPADFAKAQKALEGGAA